MGARALTLLGRLALLLAFLGGVVLLAGIALHCWIGDRCGSARS